MASENTILKKLSRLDMGIGLLLVLGFLYFNANLVWSVNPDFWQEVIIVNMVMVTFAFTFQNRKRFEFIRSSFLKEGVKQLFFTGIAVLLLQLVLGGFINPAYLGVLGTITTDNLLLFVVFLVVVSFVEESIFREIIPDRIDGVNSVSSSVLTTGKLVGIVTWASWHLYVYSIGGVIVWIKFIPLIIEGMVYNMPWIRKNNLNYSLHAGLNIVKQTRSLI